MLWCYYSIILCTELLNIHKQMGHHRKRIHRKAENMTHKTHALTQIALMTSILCIIGPLALTFPFSPVPVSLTTLILYISVYVIGKRGAVISCALYLLIGIIGIPVFSGFTGGIGKILGPTGGYLVGYLFLTYISGIFIENVKNKNRRKQPYMLYMLQGLGLVFATIVCYFLGSIWLMYQTKLGPKTVLITGVIPFIPGDIVKILIGLLVGTATRKRLHKAGVL